MMPNLIDKIGEWNPQLFRELKGRLKVFNIVIALAISLIGQLGLFLYQLGDLPGQKYSMSGTYCNLSTGYQQQLSSIQKLINQVQQQINLSSFNNLAKIQQLKAQLSSLKLEQDTLNKVLYQQSCPPEQINMQLWWRDHWEYIFITLSLVFIFTLLVAGTYLLINNLAQEERRGTLNFLRLSPQSEISILTGKILGVPIVIYLLVLVALPLHLWAGISAKIALSYILSFYTVLVGSCIFFFSAALLFGLISNWFGGFQPWFASGAVFLFLTTTMQLAFFSSDFHNTATWLRLLSPFDMTSYLFPNLFRRYNQPSIKELQFFYLPLGKGVFSFLGLHLCSYAVGTYWIWEALKRRFRSSNATAFSKGQSYLLVACYQVVFWGFTLQNYKNYCPPYPNNKPINCYYDLNYQIGQNFALLVAFNLIILFGLLIILSPYRQEVQDWSRYRHQNVSSQKGFFKNSLLQDLIWSEKSPAIVTIGINLVIVTTPWLIWMIIAPMLNIHRNDGIDWVNEIGRMKAILSVALFITLMMIYAALAQSMLLMKNSKRSLWAIGTVGATIFVPPIILGMLGIKPITNSTVWLFSTFPWAGVEYSTTTTIFMALMAELSVLVLLNFRLTKQVRLAGESATKALLAGR